MKKVYAFQDSVWEELSKGLNGVMLEGSFILSEDASDREAIKAIKAVMKLSSYSKCQSNFIAGDLWNRLKGKHGHRTQLMREAFGLDMAEKMVRYFATKGYVAAAIPAPRDYSLNWSYYTRKAARVNGKRTPTPKDRADIKCLDSNLVPNGLLLERHGEYYVIKSDDADDIYIPINPIRAQLYRESVDARLDYDMRCPNQPADSVESDAFTDCAS